MLNVKAWREEGGSHMAGRSHVVRSGLGGLSLPRGGDSVMGTGTVQRRSIPERHSPRHTGAGASSLRGLGVRRGGRQVLNKGLLRSGLNRARPRGANVADCVVRRQPFA